MGQRILLVRRRRSGGAGPARARVKPSRRWSGGDRARRSPYNDARNAIVYEGLTTRAATPRVSVADGPFRGVPFLVKDLYTPVKGWPMSNGSLVRAPASATRTTSWCATATARAGMVLLGRATTPKVLASLARRERRVPRAVPAIRGTAAHLGRLERRIRVGGHGGHRADGTRVRRSRLDPHPRPRAAASSASRRRATVI